MGFGETAVFQSLSLAHLHGSHISGHIFVFLICRHLFTIEPVSHLYGAAILWTQCSMHMGVQAHLEWSREHKAGELLKDLTLTSE